MNPGRDLPELRDPDDDDGLAWEPWEYLYITGLASTAGAPFANGARCYWLTPDGPELISDFQGRDRDVSESEAVLRAIAELGAQGWEMVGNPQAGMVFFKRPKAE